MAGVLWKPVSESDGNLVLVFDKDPGTVVIKDSDGNVISTGRRTGTLEDGRIPIRFDKPGSSYQDVTVEVGDGRSFFISNGGNRWENNTLAPAGSKPSSPTGNEIQPTERPVGAAGTEQSAGEGGLPEGIAGVAPPIFIDPSLVQPFPVTPAFIPQAQFQHTDPIQYTGQVGEFNREQSQLAFETGLSRAKQVQREELASILEFAQGMSQFQQQLVGQENVFNQQQRIQAAETAIPGVQDIFARQRERAETLAEGRLLTTAEDRAFELAAQSASAEGNFVRGFGDDSVVGRTTSEKLSAQQRLGLTQLGENFLTRSLQQAAGVLMDVPLKASISQRLPSQPNVPFAQVAAGQQAAETALTTIAPQAALSAEVQQQQFATNLEQRTNEFNANMQSVSDRFNSSQFYNAMLEQLGITMFNAQQQQAFIQGQFNAIAEAQELERKREEFDKVIADYKKHRDNNQLIAGIASLFGAAATLPDWVWKGIKGLGGDAYDVLSDIFGGSDGGGDTGGEAGDVDGDGETDFPIDEETGEPVHEPSNQTPVPEEEPELEEGGSTSVEPEEGGSSSIDDPDVDPADVEAFEEGRRLTYNPRTGNYRYRFFTEEMIDRAKFDKDLTVFSSGAAIQLTRKEWRQLRGLY